MMLEQERMLPILLDLLDTDNNTELKPLTGLLRNLARHSTNKDHVGKKQGTTTSTNMEKKIPFCMLFVLVSYIIG